MAVDSFLQRVRPSLAVLGDPLRPSGTAALLDAQRGLFLAHGDAVRGDTIQAKIGDGSVRLQVLRRDVRTDLVLLVYRSPQSLVGMPQLSVADADPVAGSRVYVLVANGGIPGSFVGGQKFSLVGERKQAVPVSELRFETPPQLVGGALVLSVDGKLIGTMGATVARPGNTATVPFKALSDIQRDVQSGRIGGGGGAGGAVVFAAPRAFMPGGLTVAFSPNLNMVRHVVEGFLSDTHAVEFAVLGIQVGDAPANSGAVVRRIFPDSPASRAGLQVGDVLLAIGDKPVAKQYDFVQVMLAFKPGERTTLKIRHDGAEKVVDVVLARSKA